MKKPFKVSLESAVRYHRLLSPGEQSQVLKAGLVRLAAHEAVGEHVTASREEAIVVLEGTARVEFEGFDPVTADCGSLVYIPPDTRHNVINQGESPLRYVYLVAAVRHDEQDRP
ncbi:MAG: cupin domain-containing protein [Candidatus Omnitrophica bacterium]|nr:cupin domain-containing protein [Candidatus Omnitrophota bacterium]